MSDDNKKHYFTEREEQAVIDYITTDSVEKKNKIYNNLLIEPFRKMVQSILRRYPIHIGDYDMDEVESNALTHLIEHMVKYKRYIIEYRELISEDKKWFKLGEGYRFIRFKDAIDKFNSLPDNDGNEYKIFKSKAFSYCQTIIRNYYKDHSVKTYSDKKINLSYDDYMDDINEDIRYSYEHELNETEQLEKLIKIVSDKIECKINNDCRLKKNEIIVGDAIINVLKNWNILFLEETPDGRYDKKISNKFAKNKILFYLKEQTGLTTKEIRTGIKPFKDIYFIEKINQFNE